MQVPGLDTTTPLRRRALLTLLLLAACGGENGTLVITGSGGTEAREGISAAQMSDGFSVEFEHAIVEFEALHLRTQLGEDAFVEVDPVLVELVPSPSRLWRLEEIPARRWDEVGFVSAPPPAEVRAIGVDAALRERMVAEGWSSYYAGALVGPDGTRYPFAIGLPVRGTYVTCRSGTDRALGVAVPGGGTAELELTWHLTHLFFDSFAENSALRAEPLAAAYDGTQPVDLAALATQPLANLRGLDGGLLRDENNFPVQYIPPAEGAETLAEFVMSARFGHFNGLEGECTTEVERLSR